mmetsp:Transcript_41633/g.102586  ORF Transcript_41633/g.102586 Transcript_41633/m.102586 type:complete len:148 (-) Transcript_41633:221-664(-)
MSSIWDFLFGLCNGHRAGKQIYTSDAEYAAATKIQAMYRGSSMRREQEKERAAATKIQAMHRGNAARRDMDTRSSAQKAAAGGKVMSDLDAMKARHEKMSKGMDSYEAAKDAQLLKEAKKGGKYMEDYVEHLEAKDYKREKSKAKGR